MKHSNITNEIKIPTKKGHEPPSNIERIRWIGIEEACYKPFETEYYGPFDRKEDAQAWANDLIKQKKDFVYSFKPINALRKKGMFQ